MNYSGGSGMLPPPISYPPMMPPPPPFPPPLHFPPPMPYQNQQIMPMMGPPPPPPYYGPEMGPCSRRPARICRKRRSRRCRPVIRIIDSSSCSSLSSYTTKSSCSRRRHRSRSHSRRHATPPPQQQQQPIILLPIQCQQPAPAVAAPVQNQIQQQQQQQQPQRIILPPIQLQQSGGQQPFSPMQFQQSDGQFQQQSLASSPMQFQQSGGQFQQQPFALPPMQFDSSNLMPSATVNPMIISSGQSMIQPSISMPQMANIGQPQQLQGGRFQYVQAMPQSSSPLQYVSAEPRSTIIPQRVLVNSTNKKQTAKVKPVRRSLPARELTQNDLKYGRRPFDWYENDKKNNIINENIQIGKRGNTTTD